MTKRFKVPADYWDIGLLEQWLEEKAAQGWMPVFAEALYRERLGNYMETRQ